jgi:tRNA (cytidine/uridine-2'-O-)-methyltransferase
MRAPAAMTGERTMGIIKGLNLAKHLRDAATTGRASPQPAESAPMRLALYQPDIAQNCGAMLRLCACLGIAADVIGPCGFVWSDAKLRRAGMDYVDRVELRRHDSWTAYQAARGAGRLVLLTTRGDEALPGFAFRVDDTLMVGSESAGVPPEIHEAAAARLVIPMAAGARSLNVALAAALALGEALRQTGRWPAGATLPIAS